MSNNNISPARSRHGSQTSSSSRSPMERKETLRSFLTKTRALHDINQKTVKNLEEIIKETDTMSLEVSIEDKASCQDEVLMDSQIMTASSKILRSATTMLTKELSPYDSREFAEKLLMYVHTLPDSTLEKPNWSILEAEVSKILKRTPKFSTLSGCLVPLEKKVVVKRQPAKRDALAPTRRPQAIVNMEKDDDSIEQTVEKIRLLISDHYKIGNRPVEYFRLVLHPQNFSKTIENMLHVSFLVRDGVVKMLIDDDNRNFLILPCCKENKTAKKKPEKKANVQNVMALNIEQWRILIEAYQIESPMINFK